MAVAKDKAWLKDRNKYPSGYCNGFGKPQQCEGTKPKSASRKPMPTCEAFTTCPCQCHYDLDVLFETVGRERVLVSNPEYIPDLGSFVIPPPDTSALVAPVSSEPTPVEQTVVALPARPLVPLAERRTDTGRAARGGLEVQTWQALQELDLPATPKQVSEWIADKYTVPLPSPGAISACWDRWETMKFGEQAKKPNRFVRFVGEGTLEELAQMKAASKRQKRMSVAASRRDLRR